MFMKSELGRYALERHGIKMTIKYLDPRNVIRSRPANSQDTSLCHAIGYNAAHSAMSGFTEFAIGMVRNRAVMIPIDVFNS